MKCSPILHNVKARTSIVFTAALLLFSLLKITPASAQEGKDLYAVCAACHTIGGGKLIGPDLKGVNERHEEAWLIKFIQNSQEMIEAGDEKSVALFEAYNKIPMPPNDLSDDQVRVLLKYIEDYQQTDLADETTATHIASNVQAEDSHAIKKSARSEKDRTRNYLSLVLIAIAIIVMVVLDIFFTHMIKWRVLQIGIILLCVFFIGGIVVMEAQGLGRSQFYSPDQPIAFSHKVHAGQNKIDCRYCHTSVEQSKHAGIPSVQLCMNCHNVVKKGTITGTKEIEKIYEAYNKGKAIEWIKVHNVPDHVYFNHAQHVNVGKLDCNECHGPVETMDRIVQVEDLSMGWCIECHRTKEVPFTSNKFYESYKELHEEINAGKRSKVTVSDIGGNDCQKCHY